MQVKLVNPGRSYGSDGMVCVSATCRLLAADGITALYEEGISYQINLARLTWKNDLKGGLLVQIARIKAEYLQAMAVVQGAYPLATTPDEALGQFLSEVETGANS